MAATCPLTQHWCRTHAGGRDTHSTPSVHHCLSALPSKADPRIYLGGEPRNPCSTPCQMPLQVQVGTCASNHWL